MKPFPMHDFLMMWLYIIISVVVGFSIFAILLLVGWYIKDPKKAKEKIEEIWDKIYPLRRWFRFLYQKITRGWTDRDTWSLDETIARFAIPRLKMFKELNNGYPAGLTEEGWNQILDKIIWSLEQSFENYGPEDEVYDLPKSEFLKAMEEYSQKVQEGLELFGKYFSHLWW